MIILNENQVDFKFLIPFNFIDVFLIYKIIDEYIVFLKN